MLKILIVDDQDAVRTALEVLFEIHGLETISARTPEEAIQAVSTDDVGVVLQDMNFSREKTSGQEGIDLFRRVRSLDPDLPVLLITAFTSLETAVELVKEGAADYIAKPWDDEKLVRSVRHFLRLRELEQESARARAENTRARRALEARYDLRGLLFASQAMHQVVSLAVHVASSDAPVLIFGPNGSGKEKVAEIIQANSRRRDQPFIRVNAGGLPDDLLEAELFGAEAGAFTGATKLRVGRFEAANGGTIFLDEIGNLSLYGQAKLLRVLQAGELERLGSSATRRVNVRVISATNVDLPRAIAAEKFREDLYFRLNVIELRIPPLVERTQDLLLLADHFLQQFTAVSPKRFSAAALEAILQHDWPGNVRELQNRVQRASLVATDARVEPDALGLAAPGQRTSSVDPAPGEALSLAGDDERAAIEAALLRAQGVVAKAAVELGLSRQALYRRMERLGIVLERRPRSG
ncbi:MAG: sigma-54-dependent Fis family transcriptional regulator [Deltaproteobacteria bacterium]|nr:sigma-54-dependent Fis family transcriptional regulator [Deltaproteobacteria bacterium]